MRVPDGLGAEASQGHRRPPPQGLAVPHNSDTDPRVAVGSIVPGWRRTGGRPCACSPRRQVGGTFHSNGKLHCRAGEEDVGMEEGGGWKVTPSGYGGWMYLSGRTVVRREKERAGGLGLSWVGDTVRQQGSKLIEAR